MNQNEDKQKQYENRMLKASRSGRRLQRRTKKFWKLVIRVLRLILLVATSPILIIILLLILALVWLYFIIAWDTNLHEIKKTDSLILGKDKIISLWIDIHEDGEHKWKIVWCESNILPTNFYSSFIEWYAEQSFNSEKKVYRNLCLYHLLYIKQAKWEFEFREENKIISKIDEKLKTDENLSEENRDFLIKERKKLEEEISLATETLRELKLKWVGQNKFKDYEKKEYWFKRYVDFPIWYFESNKKAFIDMMYYNHVWSTYWDSYPNGLVYDAEILGVGTSWTYYNFLNELWKEFNEDNIADEFLNGSYGLPDFIGDINSQGEYHDFICKPCKKEGGCSCTWDPEEDYNAEFDKDDLGLKYFKLYEEFVRDLIKRKVTYVSDNIKSPFRDYIDSSIVCEVNVHLTQRDWPSNLSFWLFKWYPKVDWVRTHAGIDLAASDSCNWDDVPVYSVTDWEVVFKSYSLTSWWNSIIIKTNFNDQDYYFRYSHLKELPTLVVWEYVTPDTQLWIQGDTWPGTWEHLDLTIYKWSLKYEDYLRDSYNLGWIFNFWIADMMAEWFSDYTVWSYNESSCFNCN